MRRGIPCATLFAAGKAPPDIATLLGVTCSTMHYADFAYQAEEGRHSSYADTIGVQAFADTDIHLQMQASTQLAGTRVDRKGDDSPLGLLPLPWQVAPPFLWGASCCSTSKICHVP